MDTQTTGNRTEAVGNDTDVIRIALFGIGMNVGLCIFYAPHNIFNPLLEIIIRFAGFLIMIISALELMKSVFIIFMSYKTAGEHND